MTQQSMSARQSRWLDKLADFEFKIEYIKGTANVVADALSRRSDYEVGSIAEITLSALESRGVATLSKAELFSLPMFSAPLPDTLCAAAKIVASNLQPSTSAQASIREATESHPPSPDDLLPNKFGVIQMPSQQCSAFTAK